MGDKMNIKHYEAFLKAVELKSITKAAEELGYTQAGMSHIIKIVEEELGVNLLIRNNSGIRLSTDGEELFSYINEICNAQKILEEKIKRLKNIKTGTVRIGSISSVSTYILPGLIDEYIKLYPYVKFKIYDGEYYDIENMVKNGVVDCGTTAYYEGLPFSSVRLSADRFCAVLPKGSKYENAEVFDYRIFETEPFIMLDEENDSEMEDLLKFLHIKPNVRFKLRDDYAILAMVEKGLGIGLMNSLILESGRFNYNITVKPINADYFRDIRLIYNKGARLSFAAEAFLDYVKNKKVQL